MPAHATDPAMGRAAKHRQIGAVQRTCFYLHQNLFRSRRRPRNILQNGPVGARDDGAHRSASADFADRIGAVPTGGDPADMFEETPLAAADV